MSITCASSWRKARIQDLGEVLAGRQRSPNQPGTPRQYLRVANVLDGAIDTSDVLEMPFTDVEHGRFRLLPGDVLVNEGQSRELVGRSAVYRGDPPDCCFQNTLIRFRAGHEADSEFAHQLFAWLQRAGRFSEIATQTTSIAHLGVNRFAQFVVHVPGLQEQREIAATLKAVDDAITAAKAVVEQLARVRRDLAEDLLRRGLPASGREPGPPTPSTRAALGETPSGWRVVRLGEVLDRIEAGWSPDCEARPAAADEWGVLKVSAVSSGRFRPQENKALPTSQAPRPLLEVKVGDVLVARASGVVDLVGVASIVRDTRPRLMLSDKTLRLVPQRDVLEPEFLRLLLGWSAVRSQLLEAATGSHMRNISQLALQALWVAVPDVEQQRAIATAARACSDRVEAECAHVDQLLSVKAALADALLCGRLRVRDAE